MGPQPPVSFMTPHQVSFVYGGNVGLLFFLFLTLTVLDPRTSSSGYFDYGYDSTVTDRRRPKKRSFHRFFTSTIPGSFTPLKRKK